MLRIIPCSSTAHFKLGRQLIAELEAWDARESERIGLDPNAVTAFFHPGDGETFGDTVSAPLLLALESDMAAGCAGLRRYAEDVAELHHVYVRPQFRGRGLGRALIDRAIETAASAGYRWVRLETATFMTSAQHLYRSLGFRPRQPYRDMPPEFLAATICMERELVPVETEESGLIQSGEAGMD